MVTGLVLLLPCAVLAYEVYWAYTAQSSPTIDYRERLSDLMARRQRPGVDGVNALERVDQIYNAWMEAREAAAEAATTLSESADYEPEIREPDFALIRFGPFSREGFAPELQAMQELSSRGLDAALAEVAGAQTFLPELETDDTSPVKGERAAINIQLMKFTSLISVMRYTTARMRVLAESGDWNGAVGAFSQALALAEYRGAIPLLINYLIATAHQSNALQALRWQLADGAIPPETCAAFVAELDWRFAHRISLSDALEGELLYAMDYIQHTYAPNGRFIRTEFERIAGYDAMTEDWTAAILEPGSSLRSIDNLVWWRFPGRDRAEREMGVMYRGFIADAKLPRAQRNFDAEALIATMCTVSQDGWEDQKGVLERSLTVSDRLTRDLAATRIMLALERYRSDHAEYPATLDALAPDYLDAISWDPFAPDGRFIYRRGQAQSESAAFGYTLYSVGLDGVDNNLNRIGDDPDPGWDVLFTVSRPAEEAEERE